MQRIHTFTVPHKKRNVSIPLGVKQYVQQAAKCQEEKLWKFQKTGDLCAGAVH